MAQSASNIAVGEYTINPIMERDVVVALMAESPNVTVVIKSFEVYVTKPYNCMLLPDSMFTNVMYALNYHDVFDESMFNTLQFVKPLIEDLTHDIYDGPVSDEFTYNHREGYPYRSIIYNNDNNLWAEYNDYYQGIQYDIDKIIINYKHQFIVPLDKPYGPTELPLIAARIMSNYLNIINFRMMPNKSSAVAPADCA